MSQQDWKSMLAQLRGDAPEETADPAPSAPATPVEQQGGKTVDIVLDKKGRHGKQATIVCNLVIDDDALQELAARLKRACGVGGSARGGEILIQGDKRNAVLAELKQLGYKSRII